VPVTTAIDDTTAEVVEEYPEFDFSSVADYSTLVTLGQYMGREVDYSSVNLTDEEYAYYVDKLLVSHDYYNQETIGVTAKDDVVDISYKGYIDNELFENGSADNQQLTLNDETSGYIAGYANGLIDKEVGSVVRLELKFPDDYSSTDYAGKDVVFDVTINYIYEPMELTDEIVVAIMDGYEDYSTVAQFHEFFKAAVADEKRSNAIGVMWDDIMSESSVVNEEAYSQQTNYYYYMMLNYYQQMATYYSVTVDVILSYNNISGTDGLLVLAKDYAKFDIVFHAIIFAENIAIEESEYSTMLSEYAAEMNTTVEEIQSQYSEDDIKSILLEREMYNFLFDSCVITGAPTVE